MTDLEETLDAEPTFTVTSSATVDPANLGRSPKAVHKKAVNLDWDILLLQQTTTSHAASFMAEDGNPRKDGTQSMKGDLKKAEHEQTHLFMAAADQKNGLGFIATWHDGKWKDAIVRDPVGLPTELYVDYTLSAERKKELGVTEAEKRASDRDYDYNDGHFHTFNQKLIAPAREFTDWLDDWLRIVNPDKAPKPKAAPAPVETPAQITDAMLAGNEWSAQ